jgi:hypothetical protein
MAGSEEEGKEGGKEEDGRGSVVRRKGRREGRKKMEKDLL